MNRFAFLIHPLGIQDVVRYAPRAAGKREALVAKILEWMPPYHASTITGVRSAATGQEIVGEFVCIPLLPAQFLQLQRSEVERRVLEGARLGQELGASMVGLGGYTSVVGGAGRVVADDLRVGVTSGNSYTVSTAIAGTLEAARTLDLDVRDASVAVVGATGSIGSVCARILARQVGRLILVARSKSRLQHLAERIHRESRAAVGLETDLERGLMSADIVISATSSGGGIIAPHALRPGAIVCDVALPHDVCREVARTRRDVLVIEGGVVVAPGNPEFNFDFGYPPGLCLACMAETMTLTMEGRSEDFSIGRGLDFERVEEIAALARRHGFRLAGFRAFDQPVTREKLDEVRYERQKARRRGMVVLGG
ncbi:shikimate dehydrogenase [bacterium CPR1]|nr:shikimate dehydrogenase [bacterium CPR1]